MASTLREELASLKIERPDSVVRSDRAVGSRPAVAVAAGCGSSPGCSG